MNDDLGHAFINDHPLGYFICSKCELIVFKINNDGKYIISSRSPAKNYLNDKFGVLTCDEVLIKTLLE